MPGLEVVHQVGGYGDDGLDQAAAYQAGDDAGILTGQCGEDEQGCFPVVICHVHVGQAGAVGVAEAQGGSEDVGDDDVVPFQFREHEGDDDDGDDGEDDVSHTGQPYGDAVS